MRERVRVGARGGSWHLEDDEEGVAGGVGEGGAGPDEESALELDHGAAPRDAHEAGQDAVQGGREPQLHREVRVLEGREAGPDHPAAARRDGRHGHGPRGHVRRPHEEARGATIEAKPPKPACPRAGG